MTAHLRRGELNRYVAIQSRTQATDSFGGQSETWTTIKSVYAKIEALSGRELVAANAVATEVSHRITVNYDAIFSDPRIVATYRVLYGTRIFDVEACLNIDEENRVIELLALEGMTLG